MKKTFLMIAAVAAAFMFASCDKNGKEGGKDSDKSEVTINAKNLIVYMPFDDAAKPMTIGEGLTFKGKSGKADFVKGQKGKAYSNTGNSTNSEAYLTFDIAANSPVRKMTSFTISTWVKAPLGVWNEAGDSKAGCLLGFNQGDAAQMGALDILVENGGNADNLNMKIYLWSACEECMKSHWNGQSFDLNQVIPGSDPQEKAIIPGCTTDKYFHFVYTYDEATSTMAMWANGKLLFDSVRWAAPAPEVGEQPALGPFVLDPKCDKLYIGAWALQVEDAEKASGKGWMGYYQGACDELRIYNKAFTADEVATLYKQEIKALD